MEDRLLKLAILQLPYLATLDPLERYIAMLGQHRADILLLNEYVLNPFVNKLRELSRSEILLQSYIRLEALSSISASLDMPIVAPIVTMEEHRSLEIKRGAYFSYRIKDTGPLYKQMAFIDGKDVHFYTQQYLISYPRFDEASFYANTRVSNAPHPSIGEGSEGDLDLRMLDKRDKNIAEASPRQKDAKKTDKKEGQGMIDDTKPTFASSYNPFIFVYNDIKCALVFGYEIHINAVWERLSREGVECVLLPTSSCFDTQRRWEQLIFARSFFGSCFIARANGVGSVSYVESNERWEFYGQSMVMSPEGVESALRGTSEMLLYTINGRYIDDIKKSWRFYE